MDSYVKQKQVLEILMDQESHIKKQTILDLQIEQLVGKRSADQTNLTNLGM